MLNMLNTVSPPNSIIYEWIFANQVGGFNKKGVFFVNCENYREISLTALLPGQIIVSSVHNADRWASTRHDNTRDTGAGEVQDRSTLATPAQKMLTKTKFHWLKLNI